jgi:hypothetical protein
MIPPVTRLAAALAASLLAVPATAATITLDFTAQLIGQNTARYITGYRADGTPRYTRVAGMFAGAEEGQTFSGQISFSGSSDEVYALNTASTVSSWNSGVEADCFIGDHDCRTEAFELVNSDNVKMRATLFTDYGDTAFDFRIGGRSDRLRVTQLLGSFGGLDEGERDYRARFLLSDLVFEAEAETDGGSAARAALPVVPVAPAAGLLVSAMLALALVRRSRA